MVSDEQSPGEGDQCSPCRGTGHLISGLGGEPHQVVCPWCRGTGRRIPGIDAQQSPAEDGAPAQPSPAQGGEPAQQSPAEGVTPAQPGDPPVS
jgi:hypothetical protein